MVHMREGNAAKFRFEVLPINVTTPLIKQKLLFSL